MKRIKRIISTILLSVITLLSIEGCYIGFWDWDHDRGYQHDGGYYHDGGHDRDGGHEGRH